MPNPNLTISAKFTVKTPNSVIDSKLTGAIDLANEAVHVLVQDVGTQEAKRLLLKRLDDYLPDYLGYHVDPVAKER